MIRPRTDLLIIGHPLVATPALLCGAVALYACYENGSGATVPGLIVAGGMMMIAKTAEQADAYRRWKRDWDALAEPAARSAGRGWSLLGLAIGLAALTGAVSFSEAGAHTRSAMIGIAIMLAGAGTVILMLRGLIRRLRSRRDRPGKVEPAAVVAKPLASTPGLDAAYAALPEHCRQIMPPRR